jgi:hypothetical protein
MNSLFRRKNSLFFRKNSLFRGAQGICLQRTEIAARIRPESAFLREIFQNSLLISLFSGNSSIKPDPSSPRRSRWFPTPETPYSNQ